MEDEVSDLITRMSKYLGLSKEAVLFAGLVVATVGTVPVLASASVFGSDKTALAGRGEVSTVGALGYCPRLEVLIREFSQALAGLMETEGGAYRYQTNLEAKKIVGVVDEAEQAGVDMALSSNEWLSKLRRSAKLYQVFPDALELVDDEDEQLRLFDNMVYWIDNAGATCSNSTA